MCVYAYLSICRAEGEAGRTVLNSVIHLGL